MSSAQTSLFCRLRGFTLVIALTALGNPAGVAATIAVIGGDETEPARSLLTTALSKLPGVAVLERAELEKVAREKNVALTGLDESGAARAGALLKADALVLMTADETKHRLTLRLVVVAPGFALTGDSTPLPVPEPEKWSAIIAGKFAPFLASLTAVETTKRTPLSILRIRAVTSGQNSGRLEKELGFLLARRLMREPSLAVLERSQMGALEWETALASNPQAAFWTGSYLLDGALTVEPKGFSVAARLRPAGGGAEIPVSAGASDFLKLTDQLASNVIAALKVERAAKPWDPLSEARQFSEEAMWAYRWRLDQEAGEAADSAWALGLKDETMALLRCFAGARRLEESIYLVDTRLPVQPWTIQSSLNLLDRMDEALAWKGPDLPETWVALCADFLWSSSRVLYDFYHAPAVGAGDAEALRSLRGRLREVSARLKPLADHFPTARVEDKELAVEPHFAGVSFHSLFIVRGIFEPLWQDDARDCVLGMKRLFDDVDALPPEARSKIKVAFLDEREPAAPWIAYWNPDDRPKVRLSDLRKALLDSPSVERPIDVALMMVERRRNVSRDRYADRFEPDQMLIALRDLETALWDAREGIASNAMTARRVSEVLSAMGSAEAAVNEYASPQIDAGLGDLRVRLLKFLLTQSGKNRRGFSDWLGTGLSREQALEVLPLLREASQRNGRSSELINLEVNVARMAGEASPEKAVYRSAVSSKRMVKPAWKVSLPEVVGASASASARINRVRWKNDRLWMAGFDYTFSDQPNAIFSYDPKTLKVEKFVPPVSRSPLSDLDLIGEDIVVVDTNKFVRYVASEKKWVELPIAETPSESLWVIGKVIYVAGRGVITRIDSVSGKSEVLASSRRRPGLTILDDIPPYHVGKIFEEGGKICAVIDQRDTYRYDEATRSWQLIFEGKNGLSQQPSDRSLLLRALGGEGLGVTIPDLAQKPAFLLNLLSARAGQRPYRVMWINITYGVADGEDMWLLISDPVTRQGVIERSGPPPAPVKTIGLDLGAGGVIHPIDRLTVIPEGILLQQPDAVYFFRKTDLTAD